MKYLKMAMATALFGISINANAQCPATPDAAWDIKNQANAGTYTFTDTGAGGTGCKMSVVQGPNNNGIATVRDDMDPPESRYRARVYIDATELMAQSTGGAHRFKAFVAGNSTNRYEGTEDIRAKPALLQMFIVGQAGNAARLGGFCRTITADPADGDRARFGDGPNPGTVDLVSGWNSVEIEVVVGAGTGACRIWVNNNTEASPSWEITGLENSALVGVKNTNIGSTGATQVFATDLGTITTHFDEFESRRQTFIGPINP